MTNERLIETLKERLAAAKENGLDAEEHREFDYAHIYYGKARAYEDIIELLEMEGD